MRIAASFPLAMPSLAFLLTSAAALAQTPEQLAERAQIAAQITGADPVSVDSPGPSAIETALDLPAGTSTSTTTAGNPSQIAVLGNLGIITPQAGNDFVLLSSGIAGSNAPEPGTGFGNFGGSLGNDTATINLTLTVPPTATTVSFDFRFFSAEYPDFVLAGFNDTFSAVLSTESGPSQQLAFDSAGRPINVDSVSFFPAFTSIAGGTGFDIFTPDPAGVNYSFPGGLPDAGLTDWLSASASVTPGSTINLEFGIADIGDDILDSAVLVDNLRFGSLEILEGGDPTFRNGNDMTSDVNVLSAGGATRVGICADGVSRLLLRMNLPGPGNVTFGIANFANANESGSLGNPRAAPQGANLNVASVATVNGEKAYAVYHAPLDFVRAAVPGDANVRSRQLTINTTYTPAGGAPQNGVAVLIIERPPVVLCHGLWSNPATWNGFAPLVGDNRWDFSRVDYSNNNAGPFFINRFQIRSVSRQARAAKNRRKIASTQVDWLGHSMGGILPRSFAATGFHRRPDNFGQGDLHKLVTLNTPHWGSPMANILLGIRQTWFIGDLLVLGMDRLGMPVTGPPGAIDDLAEGSAALAAIGATAFNAHAIVGIGGSQIIGVADVGFRVAAALSPPPYSGLFRLLHFLSGATTAAVYRFQEHDFIVLRPSQEGGLAAANTSVFGGPGSIHTSITSHAPAATRCIELLNANIGGGDYAALIPAPNLTPPDDDGGGPTPAPPGQGISFSTTPTTVSGGQTVTVSVTPFGGYQPTAVLFMASSQEFIIDDTAPFSASLTVPPEAIGEFVVAAIAEDASRQVAGTNPLAFPVSVSATLTGIEVFSDRVYLDKPGQQAAITVMGNYSDGIQRNVSGSTLGTTYLTNNPAVATVSSEGVVTSVGEGSAAIVAQNGSFEVSIGVFVTFEPDLSLLGAGCPTTAGIPEIGTSGGLPVIDNLGFEITVSNAPSNSFVMWGLQIGPVTSIAGTSLPGAPACALIYVWAQDFASGITDSSGNASTPLGIPGDPSLAGLPISTQAAVLDSGLTGFAIPIGTTKALEIYVGH